MVMPMVVDVLVTGVPVVVLVTVVPELGLVQQ